MILGVVLYKAVSIFFNLLNLLIFARVFLSWFPINRDNPFIILIYKLTEPILLPARKLMEKSVFGGRGLMIDFSPLISLLALEFIRKILIYFIYTYLYIR
ncbi:MAG: YggT family protein [Epulopiscium sp.]|nr:YggT family protein [Candidatus Epulonipiscium sp.]